MHSRVSLKGEMDSERGDLNASHGVQGRYAELDDQQGTGQKRLSLRTAEVKTDLLFLNWFGKFIKSVSAFIKTCHHYNSLKVDVACLSVLL